MQLKKNKVLKKELKILAIQILECQPLRSQVFVFAIKEKKYYFYL